MEGSWHKDLGETFEPDGECFITKTQELFLQDLILNSGVRIGMFLGGKYILFPNGEQCEGPGFWSYLNDTNFGEKQTQSFNLQVILMKRQLKHICCKCQSCDWNN